MCYEMCGPDTSDDPEIQAEMDRDYAAWIEEQFPEDVEEDDEDGPEELDERQAEEAFEEFVNEMGQTVTVMGYDMDPARVLKEVDPTAYRQEFLNWLDSEERDGRYSFPWNV